MVAVREALRWVQGRDRSRVWMWEMHVIAVGCHCELVDVFDGCILGLQVV